MELPHDYTEFLNRWRNCGVRIAWAGTLDRRALGENRPPRCGHFVLMNCVAGQLTIRTGGMAYAVTAGQAIVIPPDVRWLEDRQAPRGASVIERKVFFDIITDHDAEHPLQMLVLPSVVTMCGGDAEEGWWQTLLAAGPISRMADAPSALVHARAAFDCLFDSFLRRGFVDGQFEMATAIDAPEWFTSFIQSITPIIRNPDRDLDDVIAESGYSRSQVFASFRRYLDSTPSAFIRQKRIGVAKQILLAQPAVPVALIGLRCGYKDQNLFARHFRQELGCSPTAWRKRHREQSPEGAP